MSLLSKLLGKKAGDILEDLLDAAKKEAAKRPEAPEAPAPAEVPSAPEEVPTADTGVSWGPVMPTEENQFNYTGPYYDYFSKVFTEEFPDYEIKREILTSRPATLFRFYKGEKLSLVVEIISESGTPQEIRRRCALSGMPYLRYYYNHFGWWNTRSYVTERTRSALRG